MLENAFKSTAADSPYSEEFKTFFVNQLVLIQTRYKQFEEKWKPVRDDATEGFDQLSEQIQAIDRKMDSVITQQAELRKELDEIRAKINLRQAQKSGNE